MLFSLTHFAPVYLLLPLPGNCQSVFFTYESGFLFVCFNPTHKWDHTEFDFNLIKCPQDPSMLLPMAGSPFHGWIGFFSLSLFVYGFLCGSDNKESACSAEDPGSVPRWGRSPGEGNVYPLQYSCLENPRGQRSLVGYSPWDRKDLDMTEQHTHTHTHTHTYTHITFSLFVMDTGCFRILAIVNHAAVNIDGSACIFSDFVFFG